MLLAFFIFLLCSEHCVRKLDKYQLYVWKQSNLSDIGHCLVCVRYRKISTPFLILSLPLHIISALPTHKHLSVL